jgi:hypothetical protein
VSAGNGVFSTFLEPQPLVVQPVEGLFCGGGRMVVDFHRGGSPFNFFGGRTIFDFVVVNSGSRDLLLDSVMFRMIDGTHLGGPAIPVPIAGATNQQPLRIGHGARRTFRYQHQFPCDVALPERVVLQAGLSDGGGSYRSQITAQLR